MCQVYVWERKHGKRVKAATTKTPSGRASKCSPPKILLFTLTNSVTNKTSRITWTQSWFPGQTDWIECVDGFMTKLMVKRRICAGFKKKRPSQASGVKQPQKSSRGEGLRCFCWVERNRQKFVMFPAVFNSKLCLEFFTEYLLCST